ncbi:hypothetical protein [Gulosibacter sediminis]|uniref:hypothetical protein n=1 Tax=Gulosibacter sediminis TaxID=1729695 RepID=UPI0024A9F873|nr:hypothetical protein [Gulosibacter sediminis]
MAPTQEILHELNRSTKEATAQISRFALSARYTSDSNPVTDANPRPVIVTQRGGCS